MNTPVKLALCVRTEDLPTAYKALYLICEKPQVASILPALFEAPTQIVDRAICENDEGYKQLLPYIVVTNPDYKIFSYYRGGSGEEARLHGAISIGVGGHVDIAPGPGMDLRKLLQWEASRELEEEIGVCSNGDFEFIGAIIDPTNAVGRVHLGLLTRFHLTDTDILTLEDGMIEKGQFRSLMELQQPAIYDRLENWSKAVVDYLLIDPTK